jgi:hypothetical protein
MVRLSFAIALSIGLAACGAPVDSELGTDSEAVVPRGEAPAVEPGAPTLRRLTQLQYRNTVRDLLGPDVVLPANLEPDLAVERLVGMGAAVTGLSARGVEQYESAAYDLAHQALTRESARARVLACTPSAVVDAVCAESALSSFGRRAWRRPLTAAELQSVVAIAGDAAAALGSFDAGLEFGIAALLQSPHFVYRVEHGEPDASVPGGLRYTDWEMASRLAYFLWNSAPDDALLEAAAAGALTMEAGLAAEVDRMLADPRAREGIRAMFEDKLGLADLDRIAKDPNVYLAWSRELLPAAREETLRLVEALVVDEDADWREMLISQRTFVDRRLAALYGVQAGSIDGFGEVWLPEEGGRRGFTGQASFLILESHPTSTSVTRRGKYVRERLLCQTLPSPPAGLNTAIPEPSPDAPTMRDRVAVHLEDPSCASCHQLMDPIGLAYENFDGIGLWRVRENGVVIDPSGDLDGVPFSDAWELSGALHDHPDLSGCLAESLIKIANGRPPAFGERDLLDWHVAGFAEQGHRVRGLLRELVLGPTFRRLSPPDTSTEGAE